MSQPSPPNFAPGDQFRASWLNSLARFIRSCRIIPDGSSVLGTETPDGTQLRVNLPEEADFRIDNGTNPYGGTEMRPIPGGSWSAMPGGRVVSASHDGLYERNGNKTVPALLVVRAARTTQSGAWIFDRTNCAAASQTQTTNNANQQSPAPNPFALPPNPDLMLILLDDLAFTTHSKAALQPLSPIGGLTPTEPGQIYGGNGILQPSGGPS